MLAQYVATCLAALACRHVTHLMSVARSCCVTKQPPPAAVTMSSDVHSTMSRDRPPYAVFARLAGVLPNLVISPTIEPPLFSMCRGRNDTLRHNVTA